MEKVPHNSDIQAEIVKRIKRRRVGSVLHKGRIKMLTFNKEKHTLHFHVEICIKNRLPADRMSLRSRENKLIQHWKILS